MGPIAAGSVTAFFLFDVADAIDLVAVPRLIASTILTRFTPKPPAPPYVQYRQPPVVIDGASLESAGVEGFTVRFKAFDYGVISIAMTRPVPDSWDQLLGEGIGWHDNPRLAEEALRLCRDLVERILPAIERPRNEYLTEDYLVFAITSIEGQPTAERLLASHGDTIAQLLRGEREPLSAQERAEVVRHGISYLASDLVVPTWNAAFVYDTEAGVHGALELLEFSNSQLLEFRYYDELLDKELAGIYATLQGAAWLQSWFGRRFTRAARQVHALFIDVNELTDRTENALKIAGDVYAARLLALVGLRLGLDHWKTTVREKLQTLDDIYRFAVEQTGMARGEFLELTIVLILVLELVLIFAGVTR